MATINTEVNKLIWNVKSDFQNITNVFTNKLEEITGGVKASLGGLIQGDVVGINVDHIPQMKAAIDAYVEGVHQHLENVKITTDASGALTGETATAAQEFVASVVEACKALTSEVNDFKLRLDEVAVRYVDKDADVAASLRSQGDEIKSGFAKNEN